MAQSTATSDSKVRCGVSLALLLALAAPAMPSVAAVSSVATKNAKSSDDTIIYHMRRGDTLYGLGEKFMLSRGAPYIVQRLNRIRADRQIPPGTPIRIPVRLLRSEPLSAQVIAFRGDVRIGGEPARLESKIEQGMTIETGPGSSLTIGLSNGSRINVPTRSRLRIIAMRRYLIDNRLDFDFMVEKGRIETGVSKLRNDGSRYRVRTPISVSAVRGTTFRIAFDGEEAPALTEVLDGTVGVGSGPDAAFVPIPKGFGAGVARTGSLTKEELLPPPLPLRPGKAQSDAHVVLALNPVVGAKGYHVQIGSDAGFTDIIAEGASDQPLVNVGDLADGRYFVRATAIAPSNLEGMPRNYTMRRVRADLKATATDKGWVFRWAADGAGGGKRIYHFQLIPKRSGALPIVDETGLREGGITLSTIPPGEYTWRVAIREYGSDGVTEDWMGQTDLLVAAPGQ